MANSDKVSADTTPKEVAAGSASQENGMRSEFLERVSTIPVVNAAKEYSTAAYSQVKQYNSLTSSALSAAETALLYFAVSAKPYLEKFQPQAQLVDQYACTGLNVVQEKAPFLMKPPEQLVEEARNLCSTTVTTGYQTVEGIKAMGNDALSNAKTYGLQKANDALSGTEVLVDRFLPPAFGEGSPEAEGKNVSSVTERATELTSKIGLRLYGHGVKHLMPIHKMSQESVTKLLYTVDLLQQLKQNYAKKSVQEYVDEAKTKATWIWGELNKEPADAQEAERSLEQRILSLARRTTSVLVHAYNVTSLPLASFPTTYQEGLRVANQYASELFAQFDQATNAGEVTLSILQGIREKLAALGNTIQNLSKQTEDIEMEDLGEKPASQQQAS